MRAFILILIILTIVTLTILFQSKSVWAVYKETEWDRMVIKECQTYIYSLIVQYGKEVDKEFSIFLIDEAGYCLDEKGYAGARFMYDNHYEEFDGSI